MLLLILFLLVLLSFSDKELRLAYIEWRRRLMDEWFGGEFYGNIVAIPFAFFVASGLVLYKRFKAKINEPMVSEPTTEQRYQAFVTDLNARFNQDWQTDDNLNSLVYGWNFFASIPFLSYRGRPSEKEKELVLERLKAYGTNLYGFSVAGASELYYADFGTESYWAVNLQVVDLVAQNKAQREVELAKFVQEKELDYLASPISMMSNKPYVTESDNLSYALWSDRKGNFQDMNINGHILLAGGTGSGKSNALLFWVYRLTEMSNIRDRLYIIDDKGESKWSGLLGQPMYFAREEAKRGFDNVFELFEDVKNRKFDLDGGTVYVVIDELSALVESYETRKEKEEFLRKLGQLIRQSREIGKNGEGFRLVVGMQRPDAKYFGTSEVRDNFATRVLLGGFSSEGVRMMFDVSEEDEKPVPSPSGKGYAQMSGKPIQKIMIPFVEDSDKAIYHIAVKWGVNLWPIWESYERKKRPSEYNQQTDNTKSE